MQPGWRLTLLLLPYSKPPVHGSHCGSGEILRKLSIEHAKCFLLAHLDEVNATDELSQFLNLSSFHLQREFSRFVGLSPTKYLERIRLQHAAHLLVMYKMTVLNVALQVGYSHHETFTRAFKRHFGVTPKQYQNSGIFLPTLALPNRRPTVREFGTWQLSSTRLQQTRSLDVLTARHVGPYADVPVELWDEVTQLCATKNLNQNALIGIGWDNPQQTPESQLRFDAGAVVSDADLEGMINLSPRTWAVTTFVGSLSHLATAYTEIARQTLDLVSVTLDEGPILEVYHTDSMDDPDTLQFMEILIPVNC